MSSWIEIYEKELWRSDINKQYDLPLKTAGQGFAKTKSTFLMWAITSKYNEKTILEIMEEFSININITNSYNWTLLHHAIQREYYEVIKKICKFDDLKHDVQDYCSGWSPLHLAIYRYTRISHRLSEYLEESKWRKNTKVSKKIEQTKLRAKIFKKIIKLLIRSGAAIDSLTIKKQTPLMFLCETPVKGDHEILTLLLEKGAKLDICDENKMTPVMISLFNFEKHQDIKTTEILMFFGNQNKTNICDIIGETNGMRALKEKKETEITEKKDLIKDTNNSYGYQNLPISSEDLDYSIMEMKKTGETAKPLPKPLPQALPKPLPHPPRGRNNQFLPAW